MHDDKEGPEDRVLTDHERIRELAEAHGAAPAAVERPGADDDLRISTTPADIEGESITWAAFFDRLDRTDRAVRYRSGSPDGGTAADFQVLDPGTDEATEAPSGVEPDLPATSDTGDTEPVTSDRTETEPAADTDVDAAATAPTHDTGRAPTAAEGGLIVDQIHEGPAGLDAWERAEEFLVFRNAGDGTLDLSGWTVENEAGRSYRFPEGTTLEPGARITLYSGDGTDTGDELYWNADEPVWGNKRDTITVTDAAGDRVIREPYEA